MLDYSSGTTYVWDAATSSSRPGDASDGEVLPTVTPALLDSWRRAFRLERQLEASSADETAALERWTNESLATRELPLSLQPLWNAFLTAQVRHRLDSWFAEHGIQPPRSSVTKQVQADSEAVDIRNDVLNIVRAMTPAELRQLALPAAAVHRWRRRSRG